MAKNNKVHDAESAEPKVRKPRRTFVDRVIEGEDEVALKLQKAGHRLSIRMSGLEEQYSKCKEQMEKIIRALKGKGVEDPESFIAEYTASEKDGE